MPHLIIEHSANVADLVEIDGLLECLHRAALDTGIAPVDALRTRAVSRDRYVIGDGHDDNAFVAVIIRLGAGRSDDDKRRMVDALMAALDADLGDAQRSVMLSVELQEIDPTFRVNKNNLRQIITERGDTHGR